MTDQPRNGLTDVTRRAAGLRDQLAVVDARTPEQHVATDHSGFVHVLIGKDGLPEEFEVVAGWERWLAPEVFGDAVEQACRMAMIERMVSWATVLDERLDPDAEHTKDGGDGVVADHNLDLGHGQEPAAIVANDADQLPAAEPRPASQLVEELHRLVGQSGQLFGQHALVADGTGTAASGAIVLTLSKIGGVSCVANPQWVAKQTAATMMTALGKALEAARADLSRAERAAQAPIQRLMRLCSESITRLDQGRATNNSERTS